MTSGQSTTLTLFIVFVILVVFIGKRGSEFWGELFSHHSYDLSLFHWPTISLPSPSSIVKPFGSA